MAVLFLVVAWGCGSEEPSRRRAPATDTAACTPLTWEGFGASFFLGNCTECHSAHLDGRARGGAPVGLDFDTWDGVARWAELIGGVAGVDDPTMPPGRVLDDDERARLVEWLDCGLPRDGTPPDR